MRRSAARAWSSIALLALVTCRDSSPGDGAPNAIGDGAVAVVANVNSPAWPHDPLSVASAVLSTDTLRVTVRHAGGCGTHRIALLIGSAFMESHPVQVHARIAHDAGGDLCEALVTRTLAFDLTPLKQRYRQSYGAGPAEIVVNLAGHSSALRYPFN